LAVAETEAQGYQGYQRGEPKTWLIALWGAGSIFVLAFLVLGIQYYFDLVREQQVYQKQLEPVSNDLLSLRAREDAQLHSYGYIDRSRGVVRIPIERAMELLAQEAAAGKLFYPTKPAPVIGSLQGAGNAPPAPSPAK
jgi:hypothetical protein